MGLISKLVKGLVGCGVTGVILAGTTAPLMLISYECAAPRYNLGVVRKPCVVCPPDTQVLIHADLEFLEWQRGRCDSLKKYGLCDTVIILELIN